MSAPKTFTLEAPLDARMLCLEASAGTGKTYTIEGLVARLIAEEGLPIDALLVVTFTRAATSELKSRVRAVLLEARDGLDAALSGEAPNPKAHIVVPVLLDALSDDASRAQAVTRLNLALAAFDEAQISTIHGFCKSALQEHAFDSGAAFDVDLVDSIRPLCKEIAQDWWTRSRFDTGSDFITHLEARGVDLKVMETLVNAVASDPAAPIYPPALDDNALTEAKNAWIEQVATFRRAWATHRDDVTAYLIECRGRKPQHLKSPYSKVGATEAAQASLDRWLESEAPYPGTMSEVAYFSRAQITEKLSVRAKTPVEHPFFDIAQAFLERGSEGVAWMDARVNANLHQLCAYTHNAIEAHHDSHRSMAFNDLLRALHERLTGPETSLALKAALRKRYQVALIDEFQDTDPVQWGIFEAIFGVDAQRLIVVGDPKQAIYAFRGADIATYMDARQHPDMVTQTLGTNHRSDAPLVSAVEHIFARDPDGAPFLCDIDYPRVDAANTKARYWTGADPAPGLVISLLRRESIGLPQVDKDGEPTCISTWTFNQIPQVIAAQVANFLADAPELICKDTKVRRRARAEDVAVLVRSGKQALEIQEALRGYNVSSTLRGDKSVLVSNEAKELLLIVEAVLECSRSGPAKQALVTDLLGQDFSTLAELQDDEGRWSAWMTQLKAWRTLWIDKGFASFARALTNTALPVRGEEDQTIPTRLLKWRDGERRITNLTHLLELLQETSLKSQLSPTALVAWLRAEMAADANETTEERRQMRLESDQNAVTITTIHKSKGLQYPIVWCPYLWSSFGKPRRKLPMRYRNDKAQWCLDISLDADDPGRGAHTERYMQSEREESLRLAYVALTRARHQVHLLHAPVQNLGLSPLGHLLHPGVETPEFLDDEALRQALDRIAESSAGTIGINDLKALPRADIFKRVDLSDKEPQARKRARRSKDIDSLWRRASFSGLVKSRGYLDDDEDQATTYAEREDRLDRDALSDEEQDDGLNEDVASNDSEKRHARHNEAMNRDVPLKEFKGGTQAGSCIHKVYELHDFKDGLEALTPIVKTQLSAFRFDAEAWTQTLSENIQASLNAPIGAECGQALNLPADFCLAHLTKAQRFDELDFVFPLHADGEGMVPSAAMGEAMANNPGPGMPEGYPESLKALGFMPARGFMIGSIDLVFEYGGRWYVVDYKSNTLGTQGLHYTRPAMDAAMSHSHYVLQYHIYCVALHRLLALRLPDYRPETHFGGVLYLFMRGMSPDYIPGTGVFYDTPPSALIESLSDLLGGDEG